MSRFRRFEMIETCPSFFVRETPIFTTKTLIHCYPSFAIEEELDFALDLLNPVPKPSPTLIDFTSPFDGFDTVTDLVQIERSPFYTSTRRVQHRVEKLGAEPYLQSLCDRVSALELSFNRMINGKAHKGDRKYTWTAEIKNPEKHGFDQKYKWTAEIKGEKKKKKHKEEPKVEKNYKWTAEFKGKGDESPILRTYTFKTSTGDAGEGSDSERKEKKNKKKHKCTFKTSTGDAGSGSGSGEGSVSESEKKKHKCEKGVGPVRVVEIEEPNHHGAVVLRQAFAKRLGAHEKCKGKRKELSPQDAAMMIQISFRAYLIRRSQALRALRELAVAKSKLKEIRALFNNFSYRRRVARDAEERQKFSERIIVLLLTVDAIEGSDLMVRAAKKSMVDELEAMLDVIDPQPVSKSLSMKRRTFDMPDGLIQKELADGVTQVVQMLQQEDNDSETF